MFDAIAVGLQDAAHPAALLFEHSRSRCIQVRDDVIGDQYAANLLADLQPQELWKESSPSRLTPPMCRLNKNVPVIMLNSYYSPASTAKQERAYSVDEPIDKCLRQ